MEFLKQLFGWTASVAWPLSVLIIALIYRKPIYRLLSNIGGIAGRAVNQPFELSLGEKFRIEFKEQVKTRFKQELSAKRPKDVDEAISTATNLAGEYLSIYEVLRDVPLTENQRELLRELVTPSGTKIARRLEDLNGKYSHKDVTDLVRRGLIAQVRQGYFEITHDLIAGFVVRGLS